MSTVVIYKSKYGSTKQYAGWIAEELGADLKNADDVKLQDLLPYDTIIYGAGVYIGCIAGIALISDNYEQLKDKKIIVFTVGLTDPADKKKCEDLCTKNYSWKMMDTIQTFHLRGALDYKKIGIGNKLMMKKMKIKEADFVSKEQILP